MSQLKTQKKSRNAKDDGTIEVLYQKMGDRWFAFSVMGDEVFVGSIAPEELDANGEPRANQDHLVRRRIGSA